MKAKRNIAIGKKRKSTTTMVVCRYVQRKKQLSMRGMARLLGIHHRSWQRYLQGSTSPEARVKLKLVWIMKAKSFEELIELAFKHRV